MDYKNIRAAICQVTNGLLQTVYELERHTKISVFTNHALHYLDRPYIWGGNDPVTGSDCSGYICYLLKSHGIISNRDDYTSSSLYDLFPEVKNPSQGVIVYYGKDNITHCMLCLNDLVCVGATGGDSNVCDIATARQRQARIKILPINYREDIKGYNNPFAKICEVE